MFERIKTSTANIYHTLGDVSKHFKLYTDGIGINGWTARLSNIPKNLELDLKMALLLGSTLIEANEAAQYFSSTDQAHHYRLDSHRYDSETFGYDPTPCNVTTSDAISAYEASPLWHSGYGMVYWAKLFRGKNEIINTELEECLKILIENLAQGIKEKNGEENIKGFLTVIGPGIGIGLLGCSILLVIQILKKLKMRRDNQMPVENSNTDTQISHTSVDMDIIIDVEKISHQTANSQNADDRSSSYNTNSALLFNSSAQVQSKDKNDTNSLRSLQLDNEEKSFVW